MQGHSTRKWGATLESTMTMIIIFSFDLVIYSFYFNRFFNQIRKINLKKNIESTMARIYVVSDNDKHHQRLRYIFSDIRIC